LPVRKGDFILIDYVARVKETNEVFDTTVEEVARREGLYREGEVYEPKLVVVGEGWVLKALDEGLQGLEVGKTATIEIPPERAFGRRDPSKVRVVPIRRLTARGITPRVGMQVEVDGRMATIRTIGSGRVQLDFNPPLADKTLIYEVTVRKVLEKDDEKMSALIHRRIPAVSPEKFRLEIEGDAVTIHVPEEAFYLDGIQLAKRGIAMDIQRFFPNVNAVRFVEEFRRRESS